jgi:hypothetical protein
MIGNDLDCSNLLKGDRLYESLSLRRNWSNELAIANKAKADGNVIRECIRILVKAIAPACEARAIADFNRKNALIFASRYSRLIGLEIKSSEPQSNPYTKLGVIEIRHFPIWESIRRFILLLSLSSN